MVVATVLLGSVAVVTGCSDDPAPSGTSSSGSSGSSSGSSGSSGTSSSSGTSGTATLAKARATIKSTGDAGVNALVSGTVDFEDQADGKTKVVISISGASPGDHGMHIHQNGNCDAVDGGAGLGAGGHWNPLDAGHALPQVGTGHMGDLGNVTVGADGKASITLTSSVFYAKDGANSVVGKAVIFHANPDDGSQPVGNAGGRPGCGIITKL
jgi:Cu-Zn family superoxide dismutase